MNKQVCSKLAHKMCLRGKKKAIKWKIYSKYFGAQSVTQQAKIRAFPSNNLTRSLLHAALLCIRNMLMKMIFLTGQFHPAYC